MNDIEHWTAFARTQRIAAGLPETVARTVKRQLEQDSGTPVLVFDRATGRVVDLDLRGTEDDVADRYRIEAPLPFAEARERGRPKLGVVSREVTLLPRHWDWLAEQQGGASAMLRRLVDGAIKERQGSDRARRATEAGYRFMSAIAGDLPNFEEASRALFAADHAAFEARTFEWPADVKDELGRFLHDATGADA
jgi:uncharacterized protein